MAAIKVVVIMPEEKASKKASDLCSNLITKMDKDLIEKFAQWAENTPAEKVNSKLKTAVKFL